MWEEYATDNPLAYKYTSFCIKYAEFAKGQQRSMRQIHIAGEKLFVDYAGDTVPIVDPVTGEITQAQIFVATLGASNYTYACATPRQTTADWIGAQVQTLEFIGGVPQVGLVDAVQHQVGQRDGEHQILLLAAEEGVVLERVDVGAAGLRPQLAVDVLVGDGEKTTSAAAGALFRRG